MSDQDNWTIYYNPQCGTCRKTLDILTESGVKPEVCEYLEVPLTAGALAELSATLGVKPADMVRAKEPLFQELGLDTQTLDDDAWCAILAEHPSLLQRPIVVRGDRAVIARPAETVQSLLD